MGEHPRARVAALRIGQAQSAVVAIVVNPANRMPRVTRRRPFQQQGRSRVPEREARQFRLMMLRMCRAAFSPSREMYSPLTTSPRSTSPWRIQLFNTVTPVSMPAHALDEIERHSLLGADCAGDALLIVGSSHCVMPPRNFVMLQLITTSRIGRSQSALARQSRAAAVARR